jgi:hypothetical protein
MVLDVFLLEVRQQRQEQRHLRLVPRVKRVRAGRAETCVVRRESCLTDACSRRRSPSRSSLLKRRTLGGLGL